MKALILAGEESGLHYARTIASALAARLAEEPVEVRGYADYGFETADLAVIGFWAVLKRLGYFLRVKRTLTRALDEWRPDVVCTVDYPGLNLALAAAARRRGIRTVHVVSPQVWAWRRGRIPKIERATDRLCCFFPFEPALFRPGFATFVGHPLAAEFASLARTRSGDGRPLVALLPGSRHSEIERILPTLLAAAELLPTARFVIPAANERAHRQIAAMIAGRQDIELRRGGARELLLAADAAAVASGTATLEAALSLCPTVLVYRVAPLTAWLARRLIKGVRHLGLANIVWEKSGGTGVAPMPELLQEDFTAAAVAAQLKAWLDDASAHAAAVARLEAVVGKLSAVGDPIGNIVDNLL